MGRINFFVFTLILFSLFFVFSGSVFAYYTNMPADIVVGQDNFTSSSSGFSQNKLGGSSRGIFVDQQGRLIVSDQPNHRILIWNQVPTSNNVAADLVLGQADFSGHTANRGGSRAANTLNTPDAVYSDGTRLFVVDEFNDRVLLWNTFPTQNGQNADLAVVGSLTAAGNTCDNSHVSAPTGVAVFNGKVVITDKNHHRALIWNSVPTVSGTAADIVLGEADMNTCTAPTTSDNSLNSPRLNYIDTNGKLFIVDATASHRVLIWNSIPTSNNASADVVVGQPNFTSNTARTSADGLSTPIGVFSSQNRLYIADNGNARVLIYNKIPSSNGASADVVLGQSDFTSSSSNGGGSVSASGMNTGQAVFEYNGKLFVTDSGNARVLIFNNIISTPALSNPVISNIDNGKIKVSGNVKLGNRGTYALQKVQANINGEGFSNVTNLSGGTDDGLTGTSYQWYHDFEPWAGISARDKYDVKSGYTLALKASSFNGDEDNLFIFSPFIFNSFSNDSKPTFSFSVNKAQWNRLKDNLGSYQIQYKVTDLKGNTNWVSYIDNIPVDSTKTQNSDLNISFDTNNGVISVSSKAKTIPTNANIFRVVAIDNWGHSFNVSSEVSINTDLNIKTLYSNTKDWFPLQINSITGIQTGIISSFGGLTSDQKTSFSLSTSNPTFKGLAFTGSTVSVSITDTKTKKNKIYTVRPIDSKWSIKPNIYKKSYVNISVTDIAGRYVQLPTLVLTVN